MLTCYDIRLLLPHGIILIVIYHYPGKMSITKKIILGLRITKKIIPVLHSGGIPVVSYA